MCNMHYQRWRKSPEGKAFHEANATPAQRFWNKVEKTETCWLWTGHVSPSGYGYLGGSNGLAHHFLVGKPGNGYEWDHLCFVRNCVRPAHLERVTRAENVRRQRVHGLPARTIRPLCSEPGCSAEAKGLGLCWTHYMRVYRARKQN
jgi:hypothetical protein